MSDNAPTADEKGAVLEQLVTHLFSKIDHVTFYQANILDGRRAHELDVVFINDTRFSDLHFLKDTILITECKNTANPVGAHDVGWFVRKLQDRTATVGILISLSGITGAATGDTSAHSEILTALIRDKIKILVVTRAEILALRTTNDLIDLLQKKIMSLTLARIIQ